MNFNFWDPNPHLPETEFLPLSPEDVPAQIPILPLKGLVAYPYAEIPLTIGQPRSIRLVEDILTKDWLMGLASAFDESLANPGPDDIQQVGTIARIRRIFRAPDGTIRLLVVGLNRFKLHHILKEEPYLMGKITLHTETMDESIGVKALMRNVRSQFSHITNLIPSIPQEIINAIPDDDNPLRTAYLIASFQRMEIRDAQALLELDAVGEKLQKLTDLLTNEAEILELSQKIQNEARAKIDKIQHEYYLREQLKVIQDELKESDQQTEDVENFKKKINEAGLPEEGKQEALREVDRLARLSISSPEYGVIHTYLDWVTALPWSTQTEDHLDIPHARAILNADHFGLDEVKARILEFLAVRKLRSERTASDRPEEMASGETTLSNGGAILCFVGPPGVGKTSLGMSIAKAIGRKFIRLSLGGMHDESEIRGHRRTYIGAMPGKIMQALRRYQTSNPIFMLDEIDKLSHDFHGDPASALLEVLDPEQNFEFRDNYLNIPFDLSQVIFLTTANQIETIPHALQDRMEIIYLSGYTQNEKVAIAQQYLVPRQIRHNGLLPTELSFSPAGIQAIIQGYTREAGVRNLEREIGTVCRKMATRITESSPVESVITPDTVAQFLGQQKYFGNAEIAKRTSQPGVATGLAWTPTGGDILFIEATEMPGEKELLVTGSIGKVMQESAQTALSCIRSNASAFGISPNFYQHKEIHIHVPAGAQPKDGPSAGVTIATALVSLFTRKPVASNVGMTGEITLSGLVLPVGGIKEKVLAAHQSGITSVVLPLQNKLDLTDIPQEVRDEMKFVFAETIMDVMAVALEEQVNAHDENDPE